MTGPEEARQLAEQILARPTKMEVQSMGRFPETVTTHMLVATNDEVQLLARAVLALCEQVEQLKQSREHYAADTLRYKHDLAQSEGRPPDDQQPDYRCGCSAYWYQRAETAEAALVERDAEIQRLRRQQWSNENRAEVAERGHKAALARDFGQREEIRRLREQIWQNGPHRRDCDWIVTCGAITCNCGRRASAAAGAVQEGDPE